MCSATTPEAAKYMARAVHEAIARAMRDPSPPVETGCIREPALWRDRDLSAPPAAPEPPRAGPETASEPT